MDYSNGRDDKGEPQPPEKSEGSPSEPAAIDRDRLIWDPEYRAEVARLRRQRRRLAEG